MSASPVPDAPTPFDASWRQEAGDGLDADGLALIDQAVAWAEPRFEGQQALTGSRWLRTERAWSASWPACTPMPPPARRPCWPPCHRPDRACAGAAQRSCRHRVWPGSGAAGAGHAGAAATGRGGPARQRRRRRERFAKGNAAQDAAGHGRRPAHRADAAGLAPAHAALARRKQDALFRGVRARDPGPVRAAGQPARHLADQVGNGRLGVPLPGARPLQADRAPAGRETGRARSLHRRRHRAPAIGAGRQRRARRGQRPAKHIYSIWNKMRIKRLDFAQMYDLRALRVIVDDVRDCYTALGMVHEMWTPIAENSTTIFRGPSPTATARCIRWWPTTTGPSRCRSARARCTSSPVRHGRALAL